jgi:hypothetical protein
MTIKSQDAKECLLLITEEQNRATADFVDLIANRLGSGRAIHPETAIAAAARLSGSLLLRSFGFDLETPEPGTRLLSAEANDKGPKLVHLMAALMQTSQVPLDPGKIGAAPEDRGTEPDLNTQQSLALLQSDALEIAKRHSLSLQQAAEAAALATGFIVKECVPSIGSETGFNVAVRGFVEGTKTVPPRLAKQIQPPASTP